MRTPTASQYAALTSEAGAIAYHRVRVYKAGAWRDLSKVDEQDFQVGVSWNEEQDSPVTICSVSLRRESADYSIAPLVTSSALNNLGGTYDPLIGEGTDFAVDVAVVPVNTAYSDVPDSDWMEVFRGVIDDTDAEGQTTFTGRDLGGELLDATIEVDRPYGSTAGVPVQTVMQQILDDNGFSSVQLLVLGNPDWAIGPYSQKPGILMDALQSLAAQMGWEVRYRWYEPSQAFRLTLSEPDRTTTTPTWTYSSDDYVRLNRCSTSRIDVRNRILGTYEDKEVLTADGKPKRRTLIVEDLASQARYGLRVFGITEDKTNNIDTEPEMMRLIQAALADLKDLDLEVEVTLPYNPFHELGDLICLKGPTPNFTEDQVLAIVGLGTRFGTERAETTLTLRGKPSVSLRTWRQMDISYRAPPSPTVGPLAPYSLAAESIPSGFSLTFYPPVGGPKPDMYELHLSPTPGFTPDLSAGSTTFYAESKSDTFNVTDLPPGVTRYARVVPKDRYNNAGTPSEEKVVTTRYVEPRLFQPATNQTILPRNPDFEAANADGGAPDAWSFIGTTWGAGLTTTTLSYSGARAVQFASGASSVEFGLRSELFTVRGGDQWTFGLIWKQSAFGTVGAFRVKFYADSADGSPTVGTSFEHLLSDMAGEPIGVTWLWLASGYKVPGSARYARVEVVRAPDYTGTLTVDSVEAVRSTSFWEEWTHLGDGTDPTHPFESGWQNYDTLNFYPVSFRMSTSGRVQMRGVAVAPSTPPAANAALTTLPSEYRPSKNILRYVVTSTGSTSVIIHSTGEVRIGSAPAETILSFDGVEWELP